MDKKIKDFTNSVNSDLEGLIGKAKAKVIKRLDKNNSALIIVDIQERLAPAMMNRDEAVKNNIILLKVAHELDIPVLITEQYPQGLGETISEIKAELNGKEEILDKVSFSIMKTDRIKEAIEKLGKPNIILTGMETHVCVYQTARDMRLSGYSVYAVGDAISSRFEHNYINGLELIRDYGGIITNTETVLFELLEIAGTEEFKKLSKLIK